MQDCRQNTTTCFGDSFSRNPCGLRLLGVGHGQVPRPLDDRHGADAQQVGDRHAHVVEEQFASVLTLLAQFLQDAADLEAGVACMKLCEMREPACAMMTASP